MSDRPTITPEAAARLWTALTAALVAKAAATRKAS